MMTEVGSRLTQAREPEGALQIGHIKALLLIALCVLPLFAICYGSGEANDMMEMFNLISVREAARNGNWLMPTLNGEPRWEKPPLAVWVPASLASVLGTDNLWVVRLPSVLLSLVTAWATYGIGCLCSRDRRLGIFAALILASMILFMRQGRMASYDIYATAFTTLGLLGLVGMAEDAARCGRWAVLAGVCLGLAVLAKGPVPPASVCLPFGLWLLRYHLRNGRMWVWLGIAAVLTVLTFLAWGVPVLERYPQARAKWVAEFLQFSSAKGAEYESPLAYYTLFVLWAFPWTAMFVGGLALPLFGKKTIPAPSDLERRTRWMFWLVTVLGLVFLSLASEKKPRYVLQICPTAALLTAAAFQQYCRVTVRDRLNAAAELLLGVHNTMILGNSLALLLGVIVVFTPVGTWGWSVKGASLASLREEVAPLFQTLGPVVGLLAALIIGALGVWLIRTQRRHAFDRAFILAAVANTLLMIVIMWGYRAGPAYHTNPYRSKVEEMARMAKGQQIFTLREYRPWLHVIYYSQQILPQVSSAEFATRALQASGPVFLLTRTDGDYHQILSRIESASGRSRRSLITFSDEHNELTLLRFDPPAKR